MYKVVGNLIPALPMGNFLEHERENKRKIKAKKFTDCVAQNIVSRYTINNTKGIKVPTASKEQLKNSFFVQTAVDWNELPDSIVTLPSVNAFSTAALAVISKQAANGVAPVAAP